MKKNRKEQNPQVSSTEPTVSETVSDASGSPNEQVVSAVLDSSIVQQLLDEVRNLREQLERKDDQFNQVRAELEQRLREAETSQSKDIPLGTGTMTPDFIHIQLNDRPETDIERRLRIMEEEYRRFGMSFDRDRVRRILLGLPVDPETKWIYNGHAFDTEEEMLAYKERAEKELSRVTGKYGYYKAPR
jgi:hypothetical protein